MSSSKVLKFRERGEEYSPNSKKNKTNKKEKRERREAKTASFWDAD